MEQAWSMGPRPILCMMINARFAPFIGEEATAAPRLPSTPIL